MLFVFVEMVCLSAYRGSFYGREWALGSFAYKLYHFEILPKPVRMPPRRVAEGQNIMKAFLRFFLSPSGGSGQNDKKGRLGQNDEESFPLETLPSFRPARRADGDKKTPQTNII